MPELSIWKDKKERQAFVAKGKAIFEQEQGKYAGQEDAVVLAIEPESGDVFVGRTLGLANQAAAAKHLDRWIYFVRLDDPEAAIPLPAW
jgi:hypothetical protein